MMGGRTFVERFACTNESALVEAINRYSVRMQLEILSLSVIHNPVSKHPFRAIVLFEKDIVITMERPCENVMKNG
ncbi:MAG: hypothetical protein LWW88_13005 [Acinetobacter sp.]|uniref:hypothetical protein n=1 Tax=Acinetobacter sp. TaxID=472 RepID=UPI00258F9B41|nr:hypothetical protein [Acinetobacter sp.]MCE1272446.1 hypothetical protein [Acinetobacter sp.]